VGEDVVALWQVDDLERYVDRHALLAAEDPADPPYWAHLWSGARVLAGSVPVRPGRTIELGCGLGLPGLTAARRGGRVTFVDRARPPLAFVHASAAASGLEPVGVVAADFVAGGIAGRFDLVLLAEVLYDRAAFPAIARAVADRLAEHGLALLADGARIDTRAFYPELTALGLEVETTTHRVEADGVAEAIALSAIRWPGVGRRRSRAPEQILCTAGLRPGPYVATARTSRSSGRGAGGRCRAAVPPRSCSRWRGGEPPR
jgi:predicted nicotinamide N-methyase